MNWNCHLGLLRDSVVPAHLHPLQKGSRNAIDSITDLWQCLELYLARQGQIRIPAQFYVQFSCSAETMRMGKAGIQDCTIWHEYCCHSQKEIPWQSLSWQRDLQSCREGIVAAHQVVYWTLFRHQFPGTELCYLVGLISGTHLESIYRNVAAQKLQGPEELATQHTLAAFSHPLPSLIEDRQNPLRKNYTSVLDLGAFGHTW